MNRSGIMNRFVVSKAVSARIVAILASFLLTITVARVLQPAASGTFFVIFTSVAVLATFGRLGTDNLALKLATGGSANFRREVLRLTYICVAGGLAAWGVSLLLVVVFGFSLPTLPRTVALMAASACIPQALAILAGAILRGLGHLGTGTMAELGSVPILTLAMILVSAAINTSTLTWSVLALSASSWLTAVWSVPSALRAIRSDATHRVLLEGPGETLPAFLRRNAVPLFSMMGTSLLFYVLTWAPQYVLTATSGPSSVAMYTVAARLASFISLWPSIQVSYLAPAIGRLYHRSEIDSLNGLCNRTTWQAAAVAFLPTLALTFGAAPILAAVYGSRYTAAIVPMILLAAGGYLVILIGQVNPLMLLCGLEGRALTLNGCMLLAWGTAGILVGYSLGLTGICVFAVVSSVAYAGLAALLLRRARSILSFIRRPGRFPALNSSAAND